MVACKTWLRISFLLITPLVVNAGAGRSMEETSSLHVASFFFVFSFLSFLLEVFFHNLEHFLEHSNRLGLLQAVRKIKEELMLMGFITLSLLAIEDNITRICVPAPASGDGIACCQTVAQEKWEPPHIKDDWADCKNRVNVSKNLSVFDIPEAEQVCDKIALDAWKEKKGFVPAVTSSLFDLCPAPGQTGAKLISGQHDFECPPDENGNKMVSFIDVKALHQLHTFIFLTAIFHILYSALVMFISQARVRNWTRWETYGDNEADTLEKLRLPRRFPNAALRCLGNFFTQCFKTVDPMTYVTIRRFYVVSNQLETTFDFNKQLVKVHRRDFRDLVGVSSWMWIVVIILVVVEGHFPTQVRGLKLMNTYIAIILVLIAGTKLMYIFHNTVVEVLEKINEVHNNTRFKDGKITDDDLESLQNAKIESADIFEDIEMDFWCKDHCCCFKGLGNKAPCIIMQLIRLTMFQNSITLAQMVFYYFLKEPHGSACFFKARTELVYLQLLAALIMCVMNACVTVPLYTICSITIEHKTAEGKFKKRYRKLSFTLKSNMKDLVSKSSTPKKQNSPYASATSNTRLSRTRSGSEQPIVAFRNVVEKLRAARRDESSKLATPQVETALADDFGLSTGPVSSSSSLGPTASNKSLGPSSNNSSMAPTSRSSSDRTYNRSLGPPASNRSLGGSSNNSSMAPTSRSSSDRTYNRSLGPPASNRSLGGSSTDRNPSRSIQEPSSSNRSLGPTSKIVTPGKRPGEVTKAAAQQMMSQAVSEIFRNISEESMNLIEFSAAMHKKIEELCLPSDCEERRPNLQGPTTITRFKPPSKCSKVVPESNVSSLAPLKSSSIDVQSDFKIPKSKLHHHHSPQYMHQSQALSPENANIPTNLESPTNRHSNQALVPQYMHQSQALSPGNANIPTNLESPRDLHIPTNLESPTGLHIPTNLESPTGLHIPTNLESPRDLHSQDQKRSEGSNYEETGVEMVTPLARLVSIQKQILRMSTFRRAFNTKFSGPTSRAAPMPKRIKHVTGWKAGYRRHSTRPHYQAPKTIKKSKTLFDGEDEPLEPLELEPFHSDLEKKKKKKKKKMKRVRGKIKKRDSVAELVHMYKSVNSAVKKPVAQLLLSGSGVFFILFMLVMASIYYPYYGFYQPHWTYEGWGGPSFWGTLTQVDPSELRLYNNWKGKKDGVDNYKVDYRACETGQSQSPINIDATMPFNINATAVGNQLPHTGYLLGGKQVLGDYVVTKSSKYAPLYYHDNLKFYCPNDGDCGDLYWKPGDEVEKYTASYIMFHTSSEHSIDNIHFPMEMQVYHKSKSKKYVVVSVLFNIGNSNALSVKELQKLWGGPMGTNIYNIEKDKLKRKNKAIAVRKEQRIHIYDKGEYNKAEHTAEKIDIKNLYNMASGFYHYRGSMTTPPCKENPQVDWLVQATPSHMSLVQWKTIKNLVGYPGNARPTQKLFNRKINVYTVAPETAFRMNIPRTAADTTPDPPEDVKKKYCEDNDSSTFANCPKQQK